MISLSHSPFYSVTNKNGGILLISELKRNLNSSLRISFIHFEIDVSFLTKSSIHPYLLYNLKYCKNSIYMLSFCIVQVERKFLREKESKENTYQVFRSLEKYMPKIWGGANRIDFFGLT